MKETSHADPKLLKGKRRTRRTRVSWKSQTSTINLKDWTCTWRDSQRLSNRPLGQPVAAKPSTALELQVSSLLVIGPGCQETTPFWGLRLFVKNTPVEVLGVNVCLLSAAKSPALTSGDPMNQWHPKYPLADWRVVPALLPEGCGFLDCGSSPYIRPSSLPAVFCSSCLYCLSQPVSSSYDVTKWWQILPRIQIWFHLGLS